ncbi:MAG: bifunctional hydroxymethylpyrimidine kinase/phosphomethylpyrimidine kinase [Proteobacteria bacterium]|nr:bifunctional hydroxymethylpyrimidine kinase/phosphomethylpyrimidine kinase [Pseudomonadota bacterium]
MSGLESVTRQSGRVLIIAGSDSGGGAGIQADIKTVTALGAYAATAITALTAQNTEGVFGVHDVPAAFVQQQMRLVLSDIGADCLKTGMLHNQAVIEAVVDVIQHEARGIPLVVDPVMVAKGGAPLLEADALGALKTLLLPRANIITPNLPEAELLVGFAISGLEDQKRAGAALLAQGYRAALVKGGHLADETIHDVLVLPNATTVFSGPRIETRHTHGTGCTLASAIAAGLAQGMPLAAAVKRARDFVFEAIRTAPGFGQGHGPINHAHTVKPMRDAVGDSKAQA